MKKLRFYNKNADKWKMMMCRMMTDFDVYTTDNCSSCHHDNTVNKTMIILQGVRSLSMVT